MTNVLQPADRVVVATERSRAVSNSLRTLARVSRFSSAGSRGRVGSRKAVARSRLDAIIWLAACLLPTLVASVYFGLVASPRYVTDLEISVRGAEIIAIDEKIGKLSARSALEMPQNVLILEEYVKSRRIVDDVEKTVPVREIYSSRDVDYLSRFDRSDPIEKFIKYWRKMVTVDVSPHSLAIRMKVRAFTAEDSVRIAKAIQAASEAMVNQLSERSRDSAVREADEHLRGAEERFARLQLQMKDLRNEEGTVDATATAKQGLLILSGIEKERIEVDVQLETLQRVLSPDAPSVRQLKERRNRLAEAIAERRRAMASTNADRTVLSATMLRFESLNVLREAAQKSYVDLLKAAELARIMATRQQVYLNTIVEPILPESAREPELPWTLSLVFAGACAAAFALTGLRRVVLP